MITAVEQATPVWLTAVLQRAGILSQGAVTSVSLSSNAAFNSSIAHLEVVYSADASPAAATRLLLKLNHKTDGEFEVAFYQMVMPLALDLPMLVRCYAAEYFPSSGDSYILLQDVSSTHIATPLLRQQILNGEGVPPQVYLERIIDALAQFHAYWWQHPQLNQTAEVTQVKWWFRDAAHYARHVQKRQTEFSRFVESVGAEIPAKTHQLYSEVLARLPQLWERYLEPRVTNLINLTVTNGDCYFNQFLCPRSLDFTDSQTYLVDFQDASVSLGAFDLVYLLAAFWTPTQRYEQQREENLLRRYLQVLQIHGVTGYDWEALLADYKLMLTLVIFVPVWDHTNGSDKNYWWPKMQCLTGAFQDLNCRELFEI